MPALVITTLDTAEANHLSDFPPETNWWVQETGLIGIDERALPDQICFMGLDKLCALEDLPKNEEAWDDDLHGVIRPESLDIPRLEGRVSVKNGDENHPHKCKVCSVGLEPSGVTELVAVDTLGLTGTVVENEGNGDGNVVNQTTGRDKTGKPGDHNRGTVTALQEGQDGEDHDNDETVDRHTTLGCFCEDAWGSAFQCQTVKGTDGAVGIRVTG